ncbi:MAG TPA: hypothetical protein VJB66_05550 [Candidatus Nanoarchaeia archaeon]|nr:hypothetical protein [Candidatus Nanoarchaeia archaeon]
MDRRIKRDIERILILSQKVKVLLERKKINKAKRQIRSNDFLTENIRSLVGHITEWKSTKRIPPEYIIKYEYV